MPHYLFTTYVAVLALIFFRNILYFCSDLIGTLTIISRDIYQEFGTVNRPKRTLDAPKLFAGVLGIRLC
jgi:hypothetical protein